MSMNYYSIGQRIKEIRISQQLSQAMLADLINRSAAYVSCLESGYKGMSLDTFIKIANALHTPTDMLLSEELREPDMLSSREVTEILKDCSDYENRVIVDTIKSLKTTLRGHK